MIRVIGIGSPFGDDAAGLLAAHQIAANPPPATEVVSVDRPGVALIDFFDGASAVILIDAARSGSTPGTLYDVDLDAVARLALVPAGTHEFGVAQAVALARALGSLPVKGRVLAIEISAADAAPCGELTPAVRAGVVAAVARAAEWAHRWARVDSLGNCG